MSVQQKVFNLDLSTDEQVKNISFISKGGWGLKFKVTSCLTYNVHYLHCHEITLLLWDFLWFQTVKVMDEIVNTMTTKGLWASTVT